MNEITNKLDSLIKEIEQSKNPAKAIVMARFFKTGKGEYGEGDIFLGLSVPQQRIIAKKFWNLSLSDLQKLLESPIHEYRLISLLILVDQYKKANPIEKEKIAKFYLNNSQKINNWDLIDSSADKILGEYFLHKDKSLVYELAKSENLWQKRISILTTFAFIRNGKTEDALKIYQIHLQDKHDLIHKAVGWMLRELGKKDIKTEEEFLNKFSKIMPRTMLRYAIEKFPEDKRKYYLNLK